MFKLRYFITWIGFILLLFVPIGRTNGCGVYYLRDEYRIAWFNPNLLPDAATYGFHLFYPAPFQYSIPDPEKKDYWQNCEEWATYLGEEVQAHEVFKVLYQSSADAFLSAQAEQKLNELFPGNHFIEKLLQVKHTEALSYLTLAMQAEFAHFSSTDPWGLDESLFDFRKRITSTVATAKEKIKNLDDPFLTQRYAYQLVVQSYYQGKGKECIRYCDKYFDLKQPKTILGPWAQLYKAECMSGLDAQIEANYILSRVFDLCESKKNRVHQLVNPLELEAALKFAQTPHEQSTIYCLLGLKNPGRNLKNLLTIAKLDPDSRYLPQLLLREINKIEDWLLTPRVTSFDGKAYYDHSDQALVDYMPGENYTLLHKNIPYLQKNWIKDRAYLQQLRELIATLLRHPKFTRRDFGHLAMAYLYYLDKEPKLASLHLQKIKDREDPTIELQKNIIQLLILPEQMDITAPRTKMEIAQTFKKIRAQAHLLDAKMRAYPKLILHFSRLFQQKGDVVTAGLLYNRSLITPVNGFTGTSMYYANLHYFDRFASLSDLDKLIDLAQKKDRNSFEVFLTDSLTVPERTGSIYHPDDEFILHPLYDLPAALPSLEQLYDLKGTIAFRQNKLEEALVCFEQLPPIYWQDTYEFSEHLNQDIFAGINQFAWEGARLGQFNKAKVLKRMVQLQRQAEQSGPKQAEACYLLANAYQNTSYWGRAWMMFSYGRSAYDEDDGSEYVSHSNYTFYPNSEIYYKEYYQMSRAIAYYQKVLHCEPTDELAARSTFMLGHCTQYIRMTQSKAEDPFFMDYETFVPSIFNNFRKRFGHTLAYQEVIKTCPELADYFKSR